MIKKTLITVTALGILLFASAPSLLGFSLLHLGHAIEVSTSLSAKLACSARYISGFGPQQILNDLTSYSSIVKLVNINYDEHHQQVNTDLFGLAPIEAKYRPGIGCSLNNGDSTILEQLNIPQLTDQPNPWSMAPNAQLQRQLDQLVKQDNQQGLNTRAMLVIKNGQLIGETYAQNTDVTTPLLGWSMAKSLTAIMLGRMEQLGQSSLTNTKLFPQWHNDQRRLLTLKQLLQMSSGLAFDETYAPGSDATHMLFTAASASDVAIQSPLQHTAGSFHSYSSGTTNLLTRYIHQQLGNSTQASINFLYQQIFQPLGMHHSTFETDASGVFIGSSYLYASARDWAKLGLLMLNNGKVSKHQLLPQQWVKQASQPNTSDNDKRYGFQFWLNDGESQLRWPTLPKDAYAMMGNRKQSVMIIPSENVVLLRLGWSKGDYPMESHYQKLLALVAGG